MKVLLHSIILQLLCVCTLTSTQHVVLPVCTPSQPDIYLFLWCTLQWQGYIVAKHTNSTEGTR